MLRKELIFFTAVMICMCAARAVPAQDQIQGTEPPAVYKQKKEILKREERVKRSEAIQKAARLYRGMVSSYKARRVIHAEELSRQLEECLDDPLLPESFARRLRDKQQNFLHRLYADETPVKIDVPADDISGQEIERIREAVIEKQPSVSAAIIETEKPADKILSKEELRRKRMEEKRKQREEKLALKEKRRQEKIARQQERRQEDLKRKQKKKEEREAERQAKIQKQAKTQQKPKSPDTVSGSPANAGGQDEKTARRQEIQHQTLLEYQKKFLELERAEVQRYMQLYKDEIKEKREQMKKEFDVKIEMLYQDGMEFLEQKAYHFAFDILQAVEQLKPDYKMTRPYLKELGDYFQSDTKDSGSGRLSGDSKHKQTMPRAPETIHP